MSSFVPHTLFRAGKRRLGYLTLAASLLLPALCFADCEPSVYAFNNLVVFNACTSDGTPQLNVVVLDDAAPLKVNGRVTLPSSRAPDAFASSGDQLIVLRWDRVEIYDLKDTAHPTLAAALQLEHRASTPGYPRIEQTSPDSYLVLSAIGAAELRHEAGAAKWSLNGLADREEFRRKMSEWPPEHRFDANGTETILLRETKAFRYELAWRHQSKPGEFISKQYIRKAQKGSGRVLSQLLVHPIYETID